VTSTAAREIALRQAAGVAVERASRLLLACQDPAGWWPDPAAAEVSLSAEALLALEVLEIRTTAATVAAARQIRSAQRADGSWAGGEAGAAADLSASVLAYLALLLAGDSPDAYHMAVAAGWIRDAGGVDAVGVTARAWLAMFGLAAWASVPVPSLEAGYLPARALPEGATWSRVSGIALAVIGAVRPARPPPAGLTELRPAGPTAGSARAADTVAGPTRPTGRPAALRRCGKWLADWQLSASPPDRERSGWPLSVVALHALGYPASHPAQAAGLARLHGDGGGRPEWRARSGLPPVAHTALAVEALSAAGLQAGHPALLAAGGWLLRQQIEAAASGGRARAARSPSGWSFCPDGYPRPGDTACVLTALSGLDLLALPGVAAVGDAVRWLAGTQHPDGSWSGSAVLTGYSVRALASQRLRPGPVTRAIRRGVIWLLRAQLPGGAWAGRHGASDLLATAVAATALRAAGVRAGKPAVIGALGWLLAQQNPDGGWYLGDVAEPRRAGASDPAGTAHALDALLACGGAAGADLDAAAGWLIRAQLPDGGWAQPRVAPGRPLRPASPLPARAGPAVAGALQPLRALSRYAATVAEAPG